VADEAEEEEEEEEEDTGRLGFRRPGKRVAAADFVVSDDEVSSSGRDGSAEDGSSDASESGSKSESDESSVEGNSCGSSEEELECCAACGESEDNIDAKGHRMMSCRGMRVGSERKPCSEADGNEAERVCSLCKYCDACAPQE
jgi:hypothetical protein